MHTQLRRSREEQRMLRIQIVIVEAIKRRHRNPKQIKVATQIIMTSQRQSRHITKTRVRLGMALNQERTTRCPKRIQILTSCTMTMRKIVLNCRQYTWQLSIKVKSCTLIYYSVSWSTSIISKDTMECGVSMLNLLTIWRRLFSFFTCQKYTSTLYRCS